MIFIFWLPTFPTSVTAVGPDFLRGQQLWTKGGGRGNITSFPVQCCWPWNTPKLMTYETNTFSQETSCVIWWLEKKCLLFNILSYWEDDLVFLSGRQAGPGCVLQTRRSSRPKPWQHWRPGWTWRKRSMVEAIGIPKDERNHSETMAKPRFFAAEW